MTNFLAEKQFRKRPVQKHIWGELRQKVDWMSISRRNIIELWDPCLMAKMSTCPCGFTVISPRGDEDVKKHMSIHLKDAHPGTSMTDEEIGKTIKTV